MDKESPTTTTRDSTEEIKESQSIFVIRHGDRWDYAHPEWKETAERKGDPPLSTLGHRQAREVGRHLDQLFLEEGIKAKDITLVSSPFLRCLQTSNELLSEMRNCEGDVAHTVKIRTESLIFEFDLSNQGLHKSLPNINERKHYFPRLDLDDVMSEDQMMMPSLPENVKAFLNRCDDAVVHLEKVYGAAPVLIVVTHAACCIGLTKSATNATLQDINPAAPCSIYRLTREGRSKPWKIDHYSKEHGMNGFSDHLSEIGENTFPWNHFDRDKPEHRVRPDSGYTGPPPPSNI